MGSLIDQIINRPIPIGFHKINGVRVSTVYAYDEDKYETAILHKSKIDVVQQYTYEEEAIRGHVTWVHEIAKRKTILSKNVWTGLKKRVRVIREEYKPKDKDMVIQEKSNIKKPIDPDYFKKHPHPTS